MPASRSRTHEWRRSLQQILERGGALEFALSSTPSSNPDSPEANDPRAAGSDLVWRVRMLALTDTEITVEQPWAFGRPIEIVPGAKIVGAITIGQNRWVFPSVVLGLARGLPGRPSGLRFAMPESVERSQRRSPRLDVSSMRLAEVEAWPLLDPRSVAVAERANELAFAASMRGESVAAGDPEFALPTVGPGYRATLMNIGGGGLGIRVSSAEASNLTRHRLHWFRISLAPELSVPIVASGKVVHTHIDSEMNTYAGVAFDFTFHPAHQRTVAEQIQRYIAERQRRQAA